MADAQEITRDVAVDPSPGTAPRPMPRPRLVAGERADEPDPRVAAVREVLAGEAPTEVARRWALEPVVLRRWVDQFAAAGEAAVCNRPDEATAAQRDRFLAAFAHELRTPLSVARGWLDMFVEEDLPLERAPEFVAHARAALVRLTAQVHDLELLATASLGRLPLRPRSVPLAELAGGLRVSPSDPPAYDGEALLRVDPELFGRILADLWDAAALGGTPRRRTVTVHEVTPWTEVRVVREGVPLPPALLQALFDPFERNSDETGVTLGLYVARAITVAHGGVLGVEQDEERTTWWVRVPNKENRRRGSIPMTFQIACGDVMPGCAARFEAESREDLLGQVAEHAQAEHGIDEITPEVQQAVESKIVTV